ncbi:Protein BIG GRAIN 1-like E [Linum perenne]
MSTTASSKLFKKPIHHRTTSDELDVFEASKYFSCYNDEPSHHTTKGRVSSRASSGNSTGRMSLDIPLNTRVEIRNQILKEKGTSTSTSTSTITGTKQHKQPSSPGGRLASFLNTLFHQASKKKKSKSKSTANDEDESPGGGRRKRRSSISHFTRSITDTRSWYSTSNVPAPSSCTPTKNGYKDLRSLIVGSNQGRKSGVSGLEKGSCCCKDSWLDEKLNEKKNKDDQCSSSNPDGIRIGDDDDGCESDSSSDLFELQIFDLDVYSNGLPVYETTDVASIKRGGGSTISSSCSTV